MGELEVFRGEMMLVAKGDGGGRACGRVSRVMGYCCAKKGNKELTITGKLVAVQF